MVASVNLPHGAKVTSLQFFFEDRSTDADLSLSLNRWRFDGGLPEGLATVTSFGSSGYGSRSTKLNHVVDNSDAAYSFIAGIT
jgi:hypothetical protein